MWARLYWSRRFLGAIQFGLPDAEQNVVWASYQKMIETWNTSLMNNVLQIEAYYGEPKRRYFENKISPSFAKVNNCVVKIKYAKYYAQKGDTQCVPTNPDVRNEKSNFEILQELIDDQKCCVILFRLRSLREGARL